VNDIERIEVIKYHLLSTYRKKTWTIIKTD